MYVCICNAVNDRQLKQALDEGVVSIRALRRHFGFESCCGKCTSCMRSLINEYRKAGDHFTPGDPSCKAKRMSYGC